MLSADSFVAFVGLLLTVRRYLDQLLMRARQLALQSGLHSGVEINSLWEWHATLKDQIWHVDGKRTPMHCNDTEFSIDIQSTTGKIANKSEYLLVC